MYLPRYFDCGEYLLHLLFYFVSQPLHQFLFIPGVLILAVHVDLDDIIPVKLFFEIRFGGDPERKNRSDESQPFE